LLIPTLKKYNLTNLINALRNSASPNASCFHRLTNGRVMKYIFCCLILLVIHKAQGQIISTLSAAGGGQSPEYAYDVATDKSGNLYIAEQQLNRVRKIDLSTGIITLIAGNGYSGFSGDSGLATAASLYLPIGIAVDTEGNVYISDRGNKRIRKVTKSTGIITTIGGNGNLGFSGDGGPATTASINYPYGIATDRSGNVYFAAPYSNRVRMIAAATGIITTVVGNGASAWRGDGGPADSAGINPSNLAIDALENMYITDQSNGRIRMVTKSTDVITTIAGAAGGGYSGDGGPAILARFSYSTGIAVDSAGNVYLADSNNERIRKVTKSTGIISTFAGNGIAGYSGDGGFADSAKISFPTGLAIDAVGNVYIADNGNNVVRKVTVASTGIENLLKNTLQLNMYPNPANANFTVEAISKSAGGEKLILQINDMRGRLILTQSISDKVLINVSDLAEGIYSVRIRSKEGLTTRKLIIAR